MNRKIRLLVTDNRIGMAKKIVDAFTAKNLNILKMEINPPYISVELAGIDASWHAFEQWLKDTVAEVVAVTQLDMLDFEKRALELQTIIESLNVGIVSVGSSGELLYCNKIAKQIFNLTSRDMNTKVNKVIPQNIYDPQRHTTDMEGVEFSQVIGDKAVHLYIDIRQVRNEAGENVGALLIIRTAEEARRLIQAVSRPSLISLDDIIGNSPSIIHTKELARVVAKTEANVLISGESGTGKELFARAIHLNSQRSDGPFVAVNCAAMPENLIESEFFGYERGAFTGASNSGKQGLFELASEGSIFLDEIGDLPVHLQAKILRVIQEKSIRRLGGKKEIPTDVRIISASHHNLQSLVKGGTFREDLYYRLNVVPIHIPPLRERTEDIPILAEYFITLIAEKMDKDQLEISDAAMDKLLRHPWPGNVRELQNAIERAFIFAEDVIRTEHLLVEDAPAIPKVQGSDPDAQVIHFPVELNKILANIERKYILEASDKFTSSREIAQALGVSHTTVINKLRAYSKA
ncbi:MAG: Fis family transcriptional regulator [Firmicutes bacterium]|nr:Fis family transcriptional regulator [Bacillota bacterium]